MFVRPQTCWQSKCSCLLQQSRRAKAHLQRDSAERHTPMIAFPPSVYGAEAVKQLRRCQPASLCADRWGGREPIMGCSLATNVLLLTSTASRFVRLFEACFLLGRRRLEAPALP